METVRQRVSSMEASLRKLGRQEAKYSDELDAALSQYAELQQQTADLDATELDTARRSIRQKLRQSRAQQDKWHHAKGHSQESVDKSNIKM